MIIAGANRNMGAHRCALVCCAFTAAFVLVGVLALSTPSNSSAQALPALATDCPACATTAGGDRVINIYGEMNGTPPLSWYATDAPPPAQGWAAQSQQDLAQLEADSSTTNAASDSIGEGLMGAASDAGFLASPLDLVTTLSPAGLAFADGALLIHDGNLLFTALLGQTSDPTPGNGVQPETFMGWYTAGAGTLAGGWMSGNNVTPEPEIGKATWKSAGWWAMWNIGNNNESTLAPEPPPIAPDPPLGTPVLFTRSQVAYPKDYHAQYLLAQDLPGSVEPWTAQSPTPDATLQAPALPSEASAVTNLNTDLAQPEYHTLRLDLQHILDPWCSPDPTSVTVQVPTILPDENPTDYQNCLATLGLIANVTTLADTDTTVENGDVVETNPEAGSSVQPGTTVDVAANPQNPQISEADSRCDLDNGAGSPGDPGNPPSDGTNYPAYQLVQSSPYPATLDPTGGSPAQTEIPLRWGTVGWGWRHILQSHPYTSADQQQTMQTLATDTHPTPSGYASTTQWDFHLIYAEPDGSGGTLQCARTVRVEYYQDTNAANAGVQGIRGIQNSFTGAYLGGLVGH